MFFLKNPFDKLTNRVILRLWTRLCGLPIMKDITYYLRRHKKRSRKSRQNPAFTCFYTGLTLYKKVDPYSGYTVEHLLPKTLLKAVNQNAARHSGLGIKNRVPAISIINHLIGHAPLRVKFGLRDYLHSLKIDPRISVDDQIERYVHATREYLDQFKVTIGQHRVNHMPWYYASMVEQTYRDRLFAVYNSLLTDEERVLHKLRYMS